MSTPWRYGCVLHRLLQRSLLDMRLRSVAEPSCRPCLARWLWRIAFLAGVTITNVGEWFNRLLDLPCRIMPGRAFSVLFCGGAWVLDTAMTPAGPWAATCAVRGQTVMWAEHTRRPLNLMCGSAVVSSVGGFGYRQMWYATGHCTSCWTANIVMAGGI
ncbi:hypothetical protein AVEN_239402-1 [Araneus ventricosus]|uniref:Uncharacterized protein n=1 Tax=Araneus ventricosus TaxID=182803 RepID=A0A4Y2ST51_ARAVE|nr:hypothetical protein AVEN_239402-1 [Araneus ventricosus]